MPRSVTVQVNTTLYTREALFRAAYRFTDRCYLLLRPETEEVIAVEMTSKNGEDAEAMAGEFSNELIDQRIRLDLARETHNIRELIVGRAFADVDSRA